MTSTAKQYAQTYSNKKTIQSQPIPGEKQVQNDAGGFVYELGPWDRLDRFLLLGATGNTFYTTQQKHTTEEMDFVVDLIKKDGFKVLERIIEVSDQGLAMNNEHAIIAYALVVAYGSDKVKQAAAESFDKVVRIGTHYMLFISFLREHTGMGRLKHRLLKNWITNKKVDQFAYQAAKYQNRHGYSWLDVLRLLKIKPETSALQTVFKWIKDGSVSDGSPNILQGVNKAQEAKTEKEVAKLVTEYKLVRELIPTEWQSSKAVLEAMLPNMPLTALLRNLANLTRHGVLKPMSPHLQMVQNKLTDHDYLKKSRVHPISILQGLTTYASGQSVRGSSTWTPVQDIIDTLDQAFYTCFQNVEPTGKRILIANDISGSMNSTWGDSIMKPYQITAAMSLITKSVEASCHICGFYSEIRELKISPKMRLDTVMEYMTDRAFGGTDCAAPMKYALANGMEVDAFIIYTDNETWAGGIHPSQALKKYHRKTGIPAKLIVCSTESRPFSIAEPGNPFMFDLCGFSSNTPNLISNIIRE